MADQEPPGPHQDPPGPASADPVSDLARRCLGAPARCGSTRVVAVDGRSGAGKSSLADRLADRLADQLANRLADQLADRTAPRTVRVVRLDDVYPGWNGLSAVVPLLRRWLLAPLASGRPAGYHRYDWTRGTFAQWHPVPPVDLLVLEGVGAGALALAPFRSLLVWVQAGDEVRRERAIGRDGEPFARQWDRWAAQEQAYLSRDDPRGRADVLVRT